MKIKILMILFVFALCVKNTHGQDYCNTARFETIDIFTNSQLDTMTLKYGQNVDYFGDTIDLKLFIACPDSIVDTFTIRPLVLLVHGGSFLTGSRNQMVYEALYFARKGYVSVAIDYRKGWQTNFGNNPAICLGVNQSHVAALYRAVQDIKASLRYLADNATAFKIDTGYFFVGGVSSGAFASLATQFISQSDFNSIYPSFFSTLGSLDSASNDIVTPFKIKGILSVKGVLFDTSYITPSNAIPVILLHGTADPWYPYLTDHVYLCSNYFIVQGSGDMAMHLDHLNECYELNSIINGDHSLFYSPPPNDTLLAARYSLNRRALFMKRIFCDDCRKIVAEDSTIIYDSQILTSYIALNKPRDSEINIYPNPVKDKMMIEFSWPEDKRKIEIIDIMGKVVYSYEIDGNTIIDVGNLESGVYFVRIETKEGSKVRKFIKE